VLALPDFQTCSRSNRSSSAEHPPRSLTREPRGTADVPLVDPRIAHPVWLKLECEQVSGSFKARGALNRVLSLDPAVRSRGIVTRLGRQTTVSPWRSQDRSLARGRIGLLPGSTSPTRRSRIGGLGRRRSSAPVTDPANATARPWLPPEAVTMRGSARQDRAKATRFSAPRALNDPLTCSHSSFSHTGCAIPGIDQRDIGVPRGSRVSRTRRVLRR